MLNALAFDCEIMRLILDRNRPNDPTLEYCAGWDDFAGMGLACVGAYDFVERRARVFWGESGFDAFSQLAASRDHIIGFNSSSFDDNLCKAHGIEITTTYDLLVEARLASGQPAAYTKGVTRKGFGLNDLAELNWGLGKTGDGSRAPELWQRGRQWEVIDYCMTDVWLTCLLFGIRECLSVPDGKGGVETVRLRGIEE